MPIHARIYFNWIHPIAAGALSAVIAAMAGAPEPIPSALAASVAALSAHAARGFTSDN